MRGVGWFDLSEKGPGAWGVGWLVEDVACIRGALGGPREDAAAHVHQGAGLREPGSAGARTGLGAGGCSQGGGRWTNNEAILHCSSSLLVIAMAIATLACWVAYAGVGGVGWLASSPTALESQGVGWSWRKNIKFLTPTGANERNPEKF